MRHGFRNRLFIFVGNKNRKISITIGNLEKRTNLKIYRMIIAAFIVLGILCWLYIILCWLDIIREQKNARRLRNPEVKE
jgi:tellurite resistance protein TehA-like permease